MAERLSRVPDIDPVFLFLSLALTDSAREAPATTNENGLKVDRRLGETFQKLGSQRSAHLDRICSSKNQRALLHPLLLKRFLFRSTKYGDEVGLFQASPCLSFSNFQMFSDRLEFSPEIQKTQRQAYLLEDINNETSLSLAPLATKTVCVC